MAMQYITLVEPGDEEAREWYRRYRQYKKLKGTAARYYAWRYEPGVWIMAWLTLSVVCSGGSWRWWIGVIATCSFGLYWGWALGGNPKVQRKYNRYVRRRKILRVPQFLVAAVDRKADELGIADWDDFERRRFAIFRETLLDAGPWLVELRNDCGCDKGCGHTNRLAGRVRRRLRQRVRTTATRMVKQASADYAAAIDMNKLRNQYIRGALGATVEEDG
jgi:hypothetical protein